MFRKRNQYFSNEKIQGGEVSFAEDYSNILWWHRSFLSLWEDIAAGTNLEKWSFGHNALDLRFPT